MTFLQVDRCSNEPFSKYCVYCVFYKLILRILRILQIVILEYCLYCVFYKLTSDNIVYIAYIALRILRNIALRCFAYFTTSPLDVIYVMLAVSQVMLTYVCPSSRNDVPPLSVLFPSARITFAITLYPVHVVGCERHRSSSTASVGKSRERRTLLGMLKLATDIWLWLICL